MTSVPYQDYFFRDTDRDMSRNNHRFVYKCKKYLAVLNMVLETKIHV